MKKIHLLALSFVLAVSAFSQTNPNAGIRDEKHTVFAFTNATIHKNSIETYINATLIIKDDKIVNVVIKLLFRKEQK